MMLFAVLFLAAIVPGSGGIDLAPGELPHYARNSPAVPTPTPEPVDWSSPAPVIRTPEEFREAKSRRVPVIWFEDRVYFLSEDGQYLDGDTLANPTPTPRSVGEVEFANRTGQPVEFRVYPLPPGPPGSPPGYSAFVPANSSRRGILRLGDWRYVVVHSQGSDRYPSEGAFTAQPSGVVYIQYGSPDGGPEPASHWSRRDDSPPEGKTPKKRSKPGTPSVEESRINGILQGIPRYPNALRMDLPESVPNYVVFKTLDTAEKVLEFYDRELRSRGWTRFDDGRGSISYMKPDRKVSIEIFPSRPGSASRQFLLKVYPLD